MNLDDRLLSPTRWVSAGVIPVLLAAFVILYLFPGETMRLWSWMVCPEMSAFVLGGGYLAGAYYFARVWRAGEWHRVGVGFVAVTVFSTMLLAVTVLHWSNFNHGHVSFWAWLALYAVTPPLLPLLWARNRRTDPGKLPPGDVEVPRRLRTAVGIGGALQLAFALAVLAWPDAIAGGWPWAVDVATLRAMSAFIAFPAVTWVWFLIERRWSSFRITQHVATLGFVLILLGALQSRAEFRSGGHYWAYVAGLGLGLGLNVALYVGMERRAARAAAAAASQPLADAEPPPDRPLVGAGRAG
ncbi:MAG: hypothetical protein ACLGI2_16335 [Acidimicrobiia bacterium]